MIYHLKGTLTEASPLHITIDVHGVGYGILTPINTLGKLPQIGKEILLYTSLQVREDSQKLYGFLTKEERALFEKLIEISGIGPKTALSLLGHLEISDLEIALQQSNTALLSKVPGIGKKTAERLTIEMKDKIKSLKGTSLTGISSLKETGPVADAISALINLGYSAVQAQKAVNSAAKDIGKEPQLADLIKVALKNF
jgi:Holliday junction DNA helicase RuvA